MDEARKREGSVKDGLSFEQFLTMLRADSRDSLSNYDDRMGGGSLHSGSNPSAHGGSSNPSMHGGGGGGSCHGSAGGSAHVGGSLAALLDRSVRAGEVFQPVKLLDPVAEAA